MTVERDPDPLVIPPTRTPRLSVLLPLYGRGDLAVSAITAIAETTSIPYEVIVVDNASPDDALDVLTRSARGITLVQNRLNLGFGVAINQAAMRARGELLLLLNSDVVVEPGWLEPLLELLDRDPRLAAVSPALLHEDGTVQELGSVVYADASTQSLLEQSELDQLRPRVVPYVSAACLLVRRRAFTAIGGMDPAYPAGYYEDVELAVDLARRGLRSACDPRARARHLRHGSTSPSRAAALTMHNRPIFASRCADALADAPAPPRVDGPGVRARARAAAAVDRLLVVDDAHHLDAGSGYPRMASFLKRVRARHPAAAITFLVSDLGDRRGARLLAQEGIEVVDCRSELAGQPHGEATPEGAWIAQRAAHWSAIMVSRPHTLEHLRPVIDATQPQAIRVVDVEAIVSRRLRSQARLLQALGDSRAELLWAEAAAEQRREEESWRWADVITCVSDEEAATVEEAVVGAEVVVLPWGVPLTVPAPREGRSGLAFLGGFLSGEDAPNADCVRYIVDDLLPDLSSALPDTSLTIIGSNPTPSVLARASRQVMVAGWVPDAVAALGRHLVHLAPLRFGSGINLKLIDSMAAGTPFITSSIGAEGLHLGDLSEVLVADDPTDLVAKTARLMTDQELWEHVQTRLQEIAGEHFSLAAFDASIDRLMQLLGAVPG